MDVGATRGADPGREGSGPQPSAEEFAGQRAASLRRMFPGGPQPLTAAAAGPEPATAAPEPVAAPEPPVGPAVGSGRRDRRWLWFAATLALGAVGGVAALRPVAESREVPAQPATGQQLAAPPPATAVSAGPASAAAIAATSAAPTTPPSSAARSATPHRSAPPPAGTTTPAPKATTAAPVAAKPISAYSACITGNAAVLTVTFNADFTWRHAFLDVDGDTHTGYLVEEVPGGIGADFMIENGALFRARGPQWSWVKLGAVGQSLHGRAYRWQVPLASIESPAALKVVYNGSGDSPDASTPVLAARAC